MITIKQTHVTELVVFPGWISNGKWAIRRDCVQNAALFTSEATIRASFPKVKGHLLRMMDTNEGIERIMNALDADKLRAFTLTQWTYDGTEDRFALLKGEGVHSFVSRSYLALLHAPATLYAVNGTSTLTDALDRSERTIVVMPCQISKDLSHLAPIVDLVRAMPIAEPELAEVGR